MSLFLERAALLRRHHSILATASAQLLFLLPPNQRRFAPLELVDHPWGCTSPTSMDPLARTCSHRSHRNRCSCGRLSRGRRSTSSSRHRGTMTTRYMNWLEIMVSHDIRPLLFPCTYAHHPFLSFTVNTLEGMTIGPPPKILFDFELDDTHSWSQVSLAGTRTSSSSNSIIWGARTGIVNDFASSTCQDHGPLSSFSRWSFPWYVTSSIISTLVV